MKKIITTAAIDNCIGEAESYLRQFDLNKTQLIIEAIEKKFLESFDKDNVKTSKDWQDSFDIYKNLNKIITDNLFFSHNEDGFPDAQKFGKQYLKTSFITIDDIVLYFLKDRRDLLLKRQKFNV